MFKRRICKLCNEEFQPASAKQFYCKKVILKVCPVCGNTYDTYCQPSNPVTCSNPKCKRSAAIVGNKLRTRKCRVCGSEFIPQSTRQLDCGKIITKQCVICGSNFEDKCGINFTKSTCSNPKCRATYAHQKSVESYKDKPKLCVICNQEFIPTNNTQVICTRRHFRTCKVCGKHFELILSKGYNVKYLPVTCSKECATQLGFANGNPFQKQECRDKAKATMLEKYGADHPMHSKEILEKLDKTMQERYGVKRFTQSPMYVERAIETNRKRYGTDWAIQSEETKAKVETTLIGNYGITNPGQSKEFMLKAAQTRKERYGYEYAFQDPKAVEHMKQVNLERYGSEYALDNPEIKAKSDATNLERYGTIYPTQSKQVQDKIRATNIKRYGVEIASQSPEIQAKIANTMFERYGVHRYEARWDYRKTVMTDPNKINNWRAFIENTEEYINSHYEDKPTYKQLSEDLGVNETTIQVHLARMNKLDLIKITSSYWEDDVVKFIKTIAPNVTIQRRNRKLITPYEIDIYLPEYNVGIEVNPTATHNSTFSPYDDGPKVPSYHKMKTDMCTNKGVFLFHIFGYEWTNKQQIIESMLANILGRTSNKIYARKCILEEVSIKDSIEFLDDNHRQGGAYSKVNLGLYYNDELVSLMTFGKMRSTMGTGNQDLSDCWELVRFCNKLNTSVVGGASKLFKHFVNTYNPQRIRSFSDRAHTRGTLYQTLGFKEVNRSDANYVWVDIETDKAYHRVNAQKRNLKKFLHDDNIDLDQTEKQIMESHGFAQVFDSGTITWEWNS